MYMYFDIFFLRIYREIEMLCFLDITKGHLSSDPFIFFAKLFLFRHGFLDDLFLRIKLCYFSIFIGLFYSPKLDSFPGQALHFFTLHEST